MKQIYITLFLCLIALNTSAQATYSCYEKFTCSYDEYVGDYTNCSSIPFDGVLEIASDNSSISLISSNEVIDQYFVAQVQQDSLTNNWIFTIANSEGNMLLLKINYSSKEFWIEPKLPSPDTFLYHYKYN